jgi:hypothetical protein
VKSYKPRGFKKTGRERKGFAGVPAAAAAKHVHWDYFTRVAAMMVCEP